MSLLAFNLGVELGQLLIVFAAIPAVLLLARWQLGPNALVAANLATITIAVMWFSDRAFGTEFMFSSYASGASAITDAARPVFAESVQHVSDREEAHAMGWTISCR